MYFNQVTLVGVGLLGGSLGLALQKYALTKRVVAYVRRAAGVTECDERKIAHAATRDLKEAVQEADLVILCTPVAQMRPLVEELLPALRAGVLVTDVGSVKAALVQELEPLVESASGVFVGSHPMAGGERIGMGAARVDLFHRATCIITPTRQSPAAAVNAIESLWKGVGGVPLLLSPDQHDDLVSRSSHLPHVVAAELAHYVLSPTHPKDQAKVCAGGFRDTTRVASGSPEMWRDICLANRKNLSRVLGVFMESLEEFRHTLDSGDGAAIEEFFQKAKERRDNWCQVSDASSPE